ncbi:MAG: 7-carboxy-7-deazaguanine synthase QueE [Thermodesulfobacteriota bacterium]
MPTETRLATSELFYSIQGESSFAGYPCVFIRLSGCNLRCRFCDARYSYEEEGRKQTVSEILAFCQKYPGALVEITGGEPLLQDGVYPLMNQLLALGRKVLLETNGSLSLSKVPGGVVKIMDVKCPGSGMTAEMDLANLPLLTSDDELKFVLSSREDYEWAKKFLLDHDLLPKKGTSDSSRPRLLFSPVTEELEPTELANWILADGLPVRLQLQLHTILWPGLARGV